MAVRTAVVWFKVISMLWLMQRIVAQASSSTTAKLGCANFCGNIQIPYPFGMGSNCSRGDWFSIDCNNATTPPRPFLSKIQSRVRSISLGGTISIDFPLSSTCYSAFQSVDLTGSPFMFSAFHNKFTGVGCNNLALMVLNTSDVNPLRTIGGCLSLCDNKTLFGGNNICTGIDCCQTDIPTDLKVFDVNFTTIQGEEEREGCKYGFLVNQTWFNATISSLSNLRSRKFVPAVLEWSIPKHMLSLLPASSNSTDCRPVKIRRTMDPTPSFKNICYCVNGYRGNPYLSNGCHEIDECQNPALFNPSRTLVCENILGGFRILIPEELIDGTLDIGIGIGAAFGVLILVFGGWGLHKEVKRRKKAKQKQKFFKRNGGLLLKQQLAEGEFHVEKTKLFDSKEIEKATDRFNANLILGQGEQCTVYKGMLADGKVVAVKKLKRVDESKIEEFVNEVVILSQINDRNIVKLMGCCLETEVPLLVYEFIPNGTFFNYLHHQNEDEFPLGHEDDNKV